MHTVFALLCFVVVIHWLIFPYPSGLLHWHCGNLTIAPVPAKQPRWIWINTSCEFIMNDCITTTKQSTTKPCAYFLGYIVGIVACCLIKLKYDLWDSLPFPIQHSNYAGYSEYTINKLVEALELILFNTNIQFNESIFKQILGIPMGGNASPFIADLYLSWCEYCYMTKVVKHDYAMAKLLSYNCRYFDDICTVNLQNFGDIAKDIYDNTLLLEGSTCSYKQDTFLDLYIRVVEHKFITGIYHKVDDLISKWLIILFHKAMFTRC